MDSFKGENLSTTDNQIVYDMPMAMAGIANFDRRIDRMCEEAMNNGGRIQFTCSMDVLNQQLAEMDEARRAKYPDQNQGLYPALPSNQP